MDDVTQPRRESAPAETPDGTPRPIRTSLLGDADYGTIRMSRSRQPHASALILEEDPDLGENLSVEDLAAARRLLRARVIDVTSPRWEPPPLDPSSSFGLLVLDGLLGRRLRLGTAVGTELLSSGDILRPWDRPLASVLIPLEVSWRVFRPTRLAILDERITKIIGYRPQLVVNFSGRLLRRARSESYLATVSHLTRVEDRLLLTLWHMATNWGRVTPDGLCIPFHLTHEVLGEIIGARRPSVSVAVGNLRRRDEIFRRDDGFFVLSGDVNQLMAKVTGVIGGNTAQPDGVD